MLQTSRPARPDEAEQALAAPEVKRKPRTDHTIRNVDPSIKLNLQVWAKLTGKKLGQIYNEAFEAFLADKQETIQAELRFRRRYNL